MPAFAPRAVVIATACAALAGLGCDTALHAGHAADAPESPSCVEAQHHSDFPWLRDNVFKVHCSAFTSCHQGGNPPGHLNLTPALAYGQLVGVAATTVPGWVRVAPGAPSESYLLVKLGEIAGPLHAAGQDGTTMPPNSDLLCQSKRSAVVRWIEAGAPAQPAAPDAAVADAPVDAPLDAPPVDAPLDTLDAP
jgi:hypothetical protein